MHVCTNFKCKFYSFYYVKTNKIFKTKCEVYTPEIKSEKTIPNSNFDWRVLENNINIKFYVNKDLNILIP